MGGGLMQLVAYGAQDIYLTGNPQITFWKVVYRRCTNFAIESVEQTFMGNAAAGSRATATISRYWQRKRLLPAESKAEIICTPFW